MLLPRSTSADASAFAERVRAALAADAFGGLPTVRMSAGILAASAPASVESMLQGADLALYNAKRAGRDRTVVASGRETARDAASAPGAALSRI